MIAGELFIDQARQASLRNLGTTDRILFENPRLTSPLANNLGWKEFVYAMQPLAVFEGPGEFECILTEKTLAWGACDANIFAGRRAGEEVAEISDLTVEENDQFLGLTFQLARDSAEEYGIARADVGFNSGDFSEGHHSIKKLHSHIRVMPSQFDTEHRQQLSWSQLSRFDRMAFIEPFDVVAYDFIKAMYDEGRLQTVKGQPELSNGYISMRVDETRPYSQISREVKDMYGTLRNEYSQLEGVFTDGDIDPITDRYKARSRSERQELLSRYLEASSLSRKSREVLEYLAANLQPAIGRPQGKPRALDRSGMAYLTKGFAGAMSWEFKRGEPTADFYFLPRIITTSGINKVFMGEALPSAVTANNRTPSEAEIDIRRQYLDFVADKFRGDTAA